VQKCITLIGGYLCCGKENIFDNFPVVH
jgi:hypothetical protein